MKLDAQQEKKIIKVQNTKLSFLRISILMQNQLEITLRGLVGGLLNVYDKTTMFWSPKNLNNQGNFEVFTLVYCFFLCI